VAVHRKTKVGGKPAKKPSSLRREFSAGFILFRQTDGGRVYLLLDYGHHWDYAKGHLEEGESAWKAAVRELREETGIRKVDRVGDFSMPMKYFFCSPKKGRVFKTVTYFLGRTTCHEVKVSDEHNGYAWLGYQDAMERLTFESAREVLAAAEAYVARRKP
jgi:bis(5'-nucleosidyl)-tetraphosphatase